MRFNYLYVLCFVLASAVGMAQQQSVYTNIMLNQYLYNPAYAGIDTGTTFTGSYRNQWVGFDGAPKTYNFSAYGNFKKHVNMTLGGLVSTERIGLFQRTGFYGSYSYKLKINKKYAISFGLSFGAVQYNVKAYDAKPYDANDNFLQSPTLNAIAFDANAGFYFYSRKFFLGFSNQQMPNSKIQWENSQGRLTPHFYAYTGYNIFFDKRGDWILQPSVLVRTDNPTPYQLEYDLKLLFKSMIWIGASYRDHSALCGILGMKINNQFTFGYSYDYTLSKLSNYSSGSHEIVLSYLIPFKKKKTASDKAKEADEDELNKIDNTLKSNIRNKKKEDKEKEDKVKEEKVKEPETPKSTKSKDKVKKASEVDNSGGTNDLRKSQKSNSKDQKFKKESNDHYKKDDDAPSSKKKEKFKKESNKHYKKGSDKELNDNEEEK